MMGIEKSISDVTQRKRGRRCPNPRGEKRKRRQVDELRGKVRKN